jgi:hypothetical protein
MKTLDTPTVAADPVISEVRRAKTAVAQKYGFDVIAMVDALRRIDEEEDAKMAGGPVPPKREAPPPPPQDPRQDQL